MDTKSLAPTGTPNPETVTTSPVPSGPKTRDTKKSGRSKKDASVEEKVPLTVSVSPTFAKKLRIVSQGLDESMSDYVESRLTSAVAKDLKRVLEEMA
jgi:hypothetical protein